MDIKYNALEGGFIDAISPGATTLSSNTTQVFSFLWVFGVVACVAAGAAILATSGVRLTTADSGSKASEIKKDIQRAVYGILGVLLLWLILNQVNPDLLRGNIGFTPIQQTGVGTGVTPVTPTTPTTPTTGPGSDDFIRKQLEAVGITVNKKDCDPGQTSNCTSVRGMRNETIGMLVNLKQSCKCTVVITGGTEPGHSSHGPNLLPVDLRNINDGAALYEFIKISGTPVDSLMPSYCKDRKDFKWYGWRFCDEGYGTSNQHWHVYK